jgi:hypothetical protein
MTPDPEIAAVADNRRENFPVWDFYEILLLPIDRQKSTVLP